jgi:hypothetical protein
VGTVVCPRGDLPLLRVVRSRRLAWGELERGSQGIVHPRLVCRARADLEFDGRGRARRGLYAAIHSDRC